MFKFIVKEATPFADAGPRMDVSMDLCLAHTHTHTHSGHEME